MTRRIIQIYRGTTAQNDAFTGAAGELTMDTTTNELRIHNGSTVGGKVVSAPTGAVMAWAGSSAPEGWLVCDGSAVSRTTYADLFAVIGTTYGTGDGSTTFNLPDQSTVHSGGIPYLAGYQVISLTNLSTTNTTFSVPEDGLMRVLMYMYNGVESFYIDDCLMTSCTNSFGSSYPGYGVGFLPVKKGTHTMRTSSYKSRIQNVIFYPFEKRNLIDNICIKY